MKNYYMEMEKRSYASAAILRRQDGDPQIMGYTGNNPVLAAYRKIRKAGKYYRILYDHKFYIGSLAVVTGFDCNLNCTGCGQHTPLIKKLPAQSRQIDIGQIYRDLDKISDAVDGIGGIALANGEGFLNKYAGGCIDYFASNPKILNMNIPTNGSVMPSKELLKKMRDHQVSATITKYRAVPEERRQQMIRLFRQYGITYTVFEDRKWYLHEYLPGVCSTGQEAHEKYKHCDKFFMLLQGRLWKCETDATRVFAGIRKEAEGDSICIKDAATTEIRKFLWEKSHLPYIESCRHCRGSRGSLVKEIPSGRQIRK